MWEKPKPTLEAPVELHEVLANLEDQRRGTAARTERTLEPAHSTRKTEKMAAVTGMDAREEEPQALTSEAQLIKKSPTLDAAQHADLVEAVHAANAGAEVLGEDDLEEITEGEAQTIEAKKIVADVSHRAAAERRADIEARHAEGDRAWKAETAASGQNQPLLSTAERQRLDDFRTRRTAQAVREAAVTPASGSERLPGQKKKASLLSWVRSWFK